MKRILPLLVLFLLLNSCRENIIEFEVTQGNSYIYLSSHPQGADIYLDGGNTYKQTPDSLSNLVPGIHAVKLKLVGYNEVQFNIYLSKGEKRYISHSFNNDY